MSFEPAKFKGEKALVIGAGRSGLAAARLLAKKGFRVLLSDSAPMKDFKPRLKGLPRAVEVEAGGHSGAILSCGFAVKSPGLPARAPVFKRLKAAGIPVFSEIEIALAFSKAGRILAVTGTNGKTTTTELLGLLMKAAARRRGTRAFVCGNLGVPAAATAPKAGPKDALVMELSSYQLEDSSGVSPDAACVLNITPDHLDHHGGLAAYVAAKAKIFAGQRPGAVCVFNYENAACRRLARRCPARVLFFSSRRRGGKLSAWTEKGRLVFRTGAVSFTVEPPPLPGRHNLENAMCAGLMALSCGARPADLRAVFASFKGVEHRLETVRTLRGVTYINDSKATNVDSTVTALRTPGGGKNIWLILGGLDKGAPYAPLRPLVKASVKTILTIGKAAPLIEKELRGSAPIERALTLERALKKAAAAARPGDMVLLSPACASFDQFRDFEHRGAEFKRLAGRLK
ncbi:MAG: UDP-N-acetylmuramoylalanine--D-glutamate ligase [Elusimicrobia bacterium]|nr:MAG: UDP-N-acetylmuramoylalanine--D-glutamate ligase [Elusimicrobiota bacterium]KAF0155871.1 MAG: UDP-N-acetylmuramoylalanine--D-glutamate ligase [Elusimicrobiota bacterium]